jgi:hypothetical protein
LIQSLLNHFRVKIKRLEEEAGIALGEVDPEELLTRNETLKEAKKRLGKKSDGAVKQARHRAKQRMAKVKYTSPIVSSQGGRVVEVTEQP